MTLKTSFYVAVVVPLREIQSIKTPQIGGCKLWRVMERRSTGMERLKQTQPQSWTQAPFPSLHS